AARLGMDANDVRRKNAISADEMPYHRPLEALGEEIEHDSGDYTGLLDKLLTALEWEKLKADLARRRAEGEAVGAGFAMFVEKSGLGPADGVRIEVDNAGIVELITGGASIGQGFETVMAQVCAQMLGVDYRHVRSRATVMTASATHNAAVKLRAKALDVAAELMQAAPDALDIVDGKVVRKDAPAGPSMTLGEIADHLEPTSKTLGEREPGLSCEGWFRVRHQVYPYGIHFAVVNVDRETGGVAVERYVIAYDIGRAINPALVEGQIVGGFAQGLGGALLEEFTFNERGDPLATTFADYLLPSVRETPGVDVILREDYKSPLNPLGIKGAGESGITGVGAAIASAIDDAIGMPGAVTQLPVTPQQLRRILNGGRGGRSPD
ncbi:MAG: xanthine dehydrogenase family protein molybdopterin-binding subunit, partial [Alphaproteobacteria bacterium]